MRLKIGVIGSCSSRDPFTTFFNKDYKTFFEVVISAQRTSVISFMSEPFNFDESSLKVIQNNEHIIQRTKNLVYDFNRCAFKELQQKEVDYLVIDNYFEIGFGIMCINNRFMVTNNTALHNTEFLKNLKEKKTITIGKNTEEYFKLYKKYCDKFFEYVETNLPHVGIVLNKPRLVYNILTKTGEIYTDERYKSFSEKYNPLLLKLDNYIEKNYNVATIEFDKDTLAYEGHRWGKAAVHYIDSYYTNFINDLKYICLTDKIRNLDNTFNNNVYQEESMKTSTEDEIYGRNLFDDLYNINQFFDRFSNLNEDQFVINNCNHLLEENKIIRNNNINLANVNLTFAEENHKLSLDIDNKNDEIKRLKEENESIRNSNINLANLNDVFEEENRKLISDVDNKNDEIKRLKEENKSIKDNNINLININAAFAEENRKLISDVDNENDEIKRLKEEK